jgi:hypothetical protein
MSRNIIIIGSEYRSCGTWVYNLIRLALIKKCGELNVYGCYYFDYDMNNIAKWHIIKSHQFDEKLVNDKTFVIVTKRNVDTMIISFNRMLNLSCSLEELRLLNIGSTHWDKICNFRGDFEDIMALNGKLKFSNNIFSEISVFFNEVIELNQLELEKTLQDVEGLEIPNHDNPNYYDPITLLHPKHKQ